MSAALQKLDNPVWFSLSETHRSFAIDYGAIRFYDPSVCPFGGFEDPVSAAGGIDAYAMLTPDFFVVGEKPGYTRNVRLKKELVCLQMLLRKRIDLPSARAIVPLTSAHRREALFDLVNQVQPGYFRINTNQTGDYVGIYQDEMLVAVAGERMQMNRFTELSAVVTHPRYAGKGFASQLVAHVANKIFDEKKIPFLHVAASNTAAISLYKKLGFEIRREISFWNFGA